ncbi:hypothetical protein SAMN04487957_101316 [Halomonas shengliensis]|uniref:Uncharacterized protein n=1 Tax=Halomonas shengliensis TaxID=419597 RepID=A0A1H0D924_9GAMM|nr:hypothetical protein SAMN04487957_101316 [Halomonas shengliensis]
MHIRIGLPNNEALKKFLVNHFELLIRFSQLFNTLICLLNILNPARLRS